MDRSASRVSETPSIRTSPFHITPINFDPKKQLITIITPGSREIVIRLVEKRVCEQTIAVKEESVNGFEEVCGSLRSEALAFVFDRELGDSSGHRR